jgi:hypothetical protein
MVVRLLQLRTAALLISQAEGSWTRRVKKKHGDYASRDFTALRGEQDCGTTMCYIIASYCQTITQAALNLGSHLALA